MDERLRFVARLLEGEKMATLCREFDVSRKTGYKIFARYKDCGLEGLTDRSRRPYRQANKLLFQIEALIVQLKREHPGWGAPKIREKLRRKHNDVQTPAISTVHAVLDRHGLATCAVMEQTKDSLWSLDLFRSESILLRSHWILVALDLFTRRIVGFGIAREFMDGISVCRMFNDAIFGQLLPKRVSTDHDPLFRFHRWLANLRVLEIEQVKSVPYVPV
jgi:transposase